MGDDRVRELDPALLDARGEPTLVVDLEGRVLHANPAAAELFDVDAATLCTRALADLSAYAGACTPPLLEARFAEAKTKKRERFAWTIVRGDGTNTPCELALVRATLADGERVVVTLRELRAPVKRAVAVARHEGKRRWRVLGALIGSLGGVMGGVMLGATWLGDPADGDAFSFILVMILAIPVLGVSAVVGAMVGSILGVLVADAATRD